MAPDWRCMVSRAMFGLLSASQTAIRLHTKSLFVGSNFVQQALNMTWGCQLNRQMDGIYASTTHASEYRLRPQLPNVQSQLCLMQLRHGCSPEHLTLRRRHDSHLQDSCQRLRSRGSKNPRERIRECSWGFRVSYAFAERDPEAAIVTTVSEICMQHVFPVSFCSKMQREKIGMSGNGSRDAAE